MDKCFVILVFFICISCGESKPKIEKEIKQLSHNDSLLLIISDKTSSDVLFRNSIDSLDTTISETHDYWNKLACDTTNSDSRRRMCGLALLERHLKDSMRLSDLPKITGRINWLKPEDITNRCWIVRGSGWRLLYDIMEIDGGCVQIWAYPSFPTKGIDRSLFIVPFRMGLTKKVSQQNLVDLLLFGKTDSIDDKIRILR